VSCNKELPHVLVIPEDDANRQIAKGFQLNLDSSVLRRMLVVSPAGGWNKVLDTFQSVHVAEMDRYGHRRVVLLIDFDGQPGRLAHAKSRIPARLTDRVFVLGALHDPESLRRAGLGPLEEVGRRMSADCRNTSYTTWNHPELRHNAGELTRMEQHVRAILFP
jgi:hypothetical protein